NWVSPEPLSPPADRGGSRIRYGLGSSEVAVGVLGRVSRSKGQAFFLEALIPLLARYPDLRLLIAGAPDFAGPAEMQRLRELAAGAHDPSAIYLSGASVDARSFLDALDILVVPSL